MAESPVRATIRAQSQNVLAPLAAFLGFVLGAGAWAIVTEPLFSDSNLLLWLGGALVAGIFLGWLFATAVLSRLAPLSVRHAAAAAKADRPSRVTGVLVAALIICVVLAILLVSTR